MAAGDPGQDPKSAEDARLVSLDERLRRASDAEKVRTGSKQSSPGKGYAQGNRVLAEMIAGPAVGVLLGWILDRWLNTAPWLLLGLLFVGIAVAVRNIIRISGERAE